MSVLGSIAERVLPTRTGRLDMAADDLFAALSNPRRRFVIRAVNGLGRGEHTSTADLAKQVGVAEEPGVTDVDDLSEAYRKWCYVSLFQTNLPELAEAGLIEWSRDDHEARPTRATSKGVEIMAAIEEVVAEGRGLRPIPFPPDEEEASRIKPLDVDAAYDLLANTRRRHVISLLADVGAGETVTQDWLACNVTAIETEYGPDDPPSKVRKTRYTTIYQSHLPKLDSYGVVHWDGRASVTVTGRIDVLFGAMQAGESRIRDPGEGGGGVRGGRA